MNQATRFAKLVLPLILVGALALAGCGGDDGVSQSLHDSTVAEKEAAEQKAADAEQKAADAEQKAADEEAARLAAEQEAAEEEAARLAAEQEAAEAEAALAKEKADQEAEAAEAARLATIATAQMALDAANTAAMALADDASDEMKRDAYRAVEMAADHLHDVLMANGGTDAEIEAAIRAAQTAKDMADHLQDMITAAAEAAADAAETARLAAISDAQMMLSDAQDAAMALGDDASAQAKQDAQNAIVMAADALLHVLMDNGGTDAEVEAATMAKNTAQMMADEQAMPIDREVIEAALDAAADAVTMVEDDSSDTVVIAADDAVAAAKKAITDAMAISEAEKHAYGREAEAHADDLDDAKMSRTAAMQDAADKAAQDATEKAEAMAVLATKLHMGIDPPMGMVNDNADTTRAAAHEGNDIRVKIGMMDPVDLSEDEDTMVAALHGWEGKRYTANSAGNVTHEAYVYSNVEDPTPGDPFDEEYAANISDGVLDTNTTEGTSSLVASPEFDHAAGVKSFEKPDNFIAVMIPGSYHGVSGTYSCKPGSGNKCAVSFAMGGKGFDLGGVDNKSVFNSTYAEWTFKPDDLEARVTGMPDADYASYGWWLHTDADGDLIASAFAAKKLADKSTDVLAVKSIDTLQGTATYMGGAAGHYALSSATGGTNDAGQFTAEATLMADFGDDTITGTIDHFMGADGEMRDWSVELKEADINSTGVISRSGTGQDDNDTVWTIGGIAADASGEWLGDLLNSGDDGVPQVAAGTFYSMYGAAGKMVGGFGANRQ